MESLTEIFNAIDSNLDITFRKSFDKLIEIKVRDFIGKHGVLRLVNPDNLALFNGSIDRAFSIEIRNAIEHLRDEKRGEK